MSDTESTEPAAEQADDIEDPRVGGTPQRAETEEEYQERMKSEGEQAEAEQGPADPEAAPADDTAPIDLGEPQDPS